MTVVKRQIKHIHCPALSALVELQQTHYNEFAVALVGGCVRAAVFDVEANDHDIVLYGYDTSEDHLHSEMFAAAFNTLLRAGYSFQQYDMPNYDNARAYAVLRVSHPVYEDVDVLFHPRRESIEEVLLNHDFNIDGFAVEEDSDGVQQGWSLLNWGIMNGILQLCRDEDQPSPERAARMVEYAYSVGWGVSQPVRALADGASACTSTGKSLQEILDDLE